MPRSKEAFLALALGSRRVERRLLADRTSGIDRRKRPVEVAEERRLTPERRQVVRRQEDRDEGSTLFAKGSDVGCWPAPVRAGTGDGFR
jgi:hypothetical protein